MGLVWERFGWSSGGEQYSFAVVDNGLYGTLRAGSRPDVTLPMVAWEGMLDAVRISRKTKSRSREMAALPPRAGALWSTAESDQLVAAFQAGASVQRLAAQHSRTPGAIESQLEKLGLVEPRQRHGTSGRPWDDHIQAPPDITGAAEASAAKPTRTVVRTAAVSTKE